jgi:hypothetical protein
MYVVMIVRTRRAGFRALAAPSENIILAPSPPTLLLINDIDI